MRAHWAEEAENWLMRACGTPGHLRVLFGSNDLPGAAERARLKILVVSFNLARMHCAALAEVRSGGALLSERVV